MTLYSPGGLNLADTTAPLILANDDSGTTDVVFAVSVTGDLTITPDGGDISLAATLAVSGAATFSSSVAFNEGSQNYVFTDLLTRLTVQGQTSGALSGFGISSADGDGTDDVFFEVLAIGTPAGATDRERLIMGWDAGNTQFEIQVEEAGTGVVRDLDIFIEGNAGQLKLITDGSITMSGSAAAADFIGTIGATTPAAGAFTTVSGSGIILTTDDTDASSATAASLTTAGGIAAVKGIWAGSFSHIAGELQMAGVDSPAQITGDVDDYPTAGFSHLRVDADGAHDITGFADGSAGKMLWLTNISGAAITLNNEDAASAAANRIITAHAAPLSISADETVILMYDAVTSRWRVYGHHA